jgi:hypothetical protein
MDLPHRMVSLLQPLRDGVMSERTFEIELYDILDVSTYSETSVSGGGGHINTSFDGYTSGRIGSVQTCSTTQQKLRCRQKGKTNEMMLELSTNRLSVARDQVLGIVKEQRGNKWVSLGYANMNTRRWNIGRRFPFVVSRSYKKRSGSFLIVGILLLGFGLWINPLDVSFPHERHMTREAADKYVAEVANNKNKVFLTCSLGAISVLIATLQYFIGHRRANLREEAEERLERIFIDQVVYRFVDEGITSCTLDEKTIKKAIAKANP